MPEAPNPKLRQPPPPPPLLPPEPSRFGYAELDLVTNFSFLRGASHPDELVYQAAQLGYRAVAVTDVCTLAGVVRAHEAAKQVGIKLIVGSRLQLQDGPDLLVWCSDRSSYGRLCRLLTLGKRRAEKGQCLLTLEDFLNHSEGLLVGVEEEGTKARRHEGTKGMGKDTGALSSSPPCLRASVPSCLPLLRASVPSLSLIIRCLHGGDDESYLQRMMDLSQSTGIPLLATNHVHYHDPCRRPLQDVLTCIRHGCTIHDAGYRLFPNGERYLKSPAQMHRLISQCPQAIQRSLEIADRCTFSLDELRYEYPHELAPPGKTQLQHLIDLTWQGAAGRYPQGVPDKVRQQILHELRLIEQLKFEAYFLTVHDLVRFARGRGILCQGRGSAANSAVCYCLGVTSVDPTRIDVLFERFISAARNEPPDIDIDFEHERREEVLQYIYSKYGRERAGMTAEVISYRGRSAVRDVGKALGFSLDVVDQMAKRLDWWTRGVLDESRLREAGLDPHDRTVRQIVALTAQLLGFPRHLGQHVGGMVMTRGPLCELVPIENAAMPGRTVIEWDKDDIDSLGILKVDCLSLGMLTCISKALALLNTHGAFAPSPGTPGEGRGGGRGAHRPHPNPPPEYQGRENNGPRCCWPRPPKVSRADAPPLQLHTIPAEDPGVYDMICSADTVGVFQIESRAQMSMLPRLRPRRFYDLVIEVAIVRPGPIQGDMVHPYLRRRSGQEQVTYPSEALRDVLAKTLGVPLFQEQAMRLAMVGAGFSAEEADRLRRAMAAWKRNSALEQFHPRMIDGMLGNGYTRQFAEQCFNQIKGFGEYGFPESHAASFALLVYASAWIKRHHPAAFCTALLNSQPMGFYAPAQIVRDAGEHGVTVLPADVNYSHWDCLMVDEKTVRLGFRLIHGFRQDHAECLVAARQTPFASVDNLHRRTRLPVAVLRRLAEADAFTSLGLSRRQALWQVMALDDLPPSLFEDAPPAADATQIELPVMPLGQEVMTDYSQTGLSLKRHPVALVRKTLREMKVITAAQLRSLRGGQWVRVAGLVLIRQRPGTASGIVFATLEDETGIVNLIIRPNVYDRFRPAARHATLLRCDGEVQCDGQVIHVIAYRLQDLSDLLREQALQTDDGDHATPGFRSRDFH